jgi:thiamine biosynthesis lipoprotein
MIPVSTQRVRPLLGTLVAIGLEDCDRPDAAISAAFAAVERVDALMRPGTAGSDVWRISAARPGSLVRVDPWTLTVLELSKDLQRDSAGVFDPCRPIRPGRLIDLELLPPDGVRCHAPVALDLGGIAKGFAVDRAVDELARHGCAGGIVNAGGDLCCFGTRTRAVWLRTGEARLAGTREALRIEIQGCAFAVSDARSGTSPREHVGYYVGATGAPVVGHWTAVIAPEAILADALCKCVMLAPPPTASALLAAHRARLVRAGLPGKYDPVAAPRPASG